MSQSNLFDISQKLVKIIETKDAERVRHWSKVLEKQKNPMVTVEVFALIRRQLAQKDEDLNRWFQTIYFEEYNPEVKTLWLDFVDLCSLSLEEKKMA
ncbi:MAG: hypothetical protein SFY66_06505 [Oculatellaceae cyanobacterium bins.114]|nr:hypothetical protein [Oculatellaceae cyanobacterium bins.114]